MTAPDLLPCPFCGCTTIIRKSDYYATCDWCGADGPLEQAVDGEVQGWNTRATPAAIREAVADLADFLDAQHKSHMTGLGRNPADYMSGYSVARDMARDILITEKPHDRA